MGRQHLLAYGTHHDLLGRHLNYLHLCADYKVSQLRKLATIWCGSRT